MSLPELRRTVLLERCPGPQVRQPQSARGLYTFKLNIARKLVFSKWREALGGNISFIITGALQPLKTIAHFQCRRHPYLRGIWANRKQSGNMC